MNRGTKMNPLKNYAFNRFVEDPAEKEDAARIDSGPDGSWRDSSKQSADRKTATRRRRQWLPCSGTGRPDTGVRSHAHHGEPSRCVPMLPQIGTRTLPQSVCATVSCAYLSLITYYCQHPIREQHGSFHETTCRPDCTETHRLRHRYNEETPRGRPDTPPNNRRAHG